MKYTYKLKLHFGHTIAIEYEKNTSIAPYLYIDTIKLIKVPDLDRAHKRIYKWITKKHPELLL